MKVIRFAGNTILFLVVVIFLLGFNLLLHEFGHCIAMNQTRGKCEGVYVPPGVKVWPLEGFGDPYPGEWEAAMGRTRYEIVPPTPEAIGFVMLMGSGSTALLSLLAMLSLWILEPRGWGRTILMVQSLCFGDLLFYTILPEFFGLRHFFLWGGNGPEPLEGAVSMGFARGDVILFVLVFSAVMFLAWLGIVWRSVKQARYANRQ